MPTTLTSQVRANAGKLRLLYGRIEETWKVRLDSPTQRAEWETACADFHAQFDELSFPLGEAGWSAFLQKESEGLELALVFLEVDQDTFRSGYRKEIVWGRLKRLQLPPEVHSRLEVVAHLYLRKRLRREFWQMVNFMRCHGSASFWTSVEVIASSSDSTGSACKARWMLLARENSPVRRRIGMEYFARGTSLATVRV